MFYNNKKPAIKAGFFVIIGFGYLDCSPHNLDNNYSH
jgi:hypothetical protein